MQSSLLKRLLASFALIHFTRADYYIDDQNYTSLLYSENPSGAKWGPFQEGGETLSLTLANGTMMAVDASQCFNYTYTYAACTIMDECQVQIPFSGSGISIHVLQVGAQGINASLTIDKGTPTYTFLSPPPGPNFYTPNVTLFSIQGIATGNHTGTMTVLNSDNKFSGMMFDYALINQTIVSESPTTSSVISSTSTLSIPTTAASTQSSSKSTQNSTNVGAIVGGTVGGSVALSAVVLVIFCLRQRCRSRPQNFTSVSLDAEPYINPFLPPESLSNQPRITPQYMGARESTTESVVTGAVNATYALPQSTSSGSSRREKSQLGLINPSIVNQTSNANVTSMLAARTNSVNANASSTTERPMSPPPSQIRQTHPTLSDEQADFVNSLYANNVPAGVIVRVIERMMAGEQRPVMDEYGSLPPPSYDHVTG